MSSKRSSSRCRPGKSNLRSIWSSLPAGAGSGVGDSESRSILKSRLGADGLWNQVQPYRNAKLVLTAKHVFMPSHDLIKLLTSFRCTTGTRLVHTAHMKLNRVSRSLGKRGTPLFKPGHLRPRDPPVQRRTIFGRWLVMPVEFTNRLKWQRPLWKDRDILRESGRRCSCEICSGGCHTASAISPQIPRCQSNEHSPSLTQGFTNITVMQATATRTHRPWDGFKSSSGLWAGAGSQASRTRRDHGDTLVYHMYDSTLSFCSHSP